MKRRRVAVLGSGGGSNFEALARYLDKAGTNAPCEIVVVAADRGEAGILKRAADRGIHAVQLGNSGSATEMVELFEQYAVDMVVLAGYLRLIPHDVVERFSGAMLNVHPALLPHFGGAGMYGERVHRAVLESGATISGVTVHLVSNDFDRGEIIAQWPVPVLAGDSVRSLADRVLAVEHMLYPAVVAAVARGVAGAGRPCKLVAAPTAASSAFVPGSLSQELLENSIAVLITAPPQVRL